MMDEKALERVASFINYVHNGLVSSCQCCHKHPVPFDFIVDDELWQSVEMPDEWKPSVICLPCFAEMASEQGLDVHEALLLVYFTGGGKTTQLIPVKYFTAALDLLSEIDE